MGYRDADIFGGDSPEKRDADIFTAPPAEKSAPTMEPPQEEKSLGQYYVDRMKQAPLNMARGLLKGGMGGLAQAATGEALQTVGDATDKAAYNAGGAVTDVTGSPAAGYVANVATQALPTVLSGRGAQTLVSPAMESAGKRIMQAALKPTYQDLRKGKGDRAVQTLLDEGINPTQGGVNTLQSRVDELSQKVEKLISGSGARVSTTEVADTAAQAYPKFSKGPQAVTAADDIGKVQTAFMEHPAVGGAKDIPVQLAQEMKSGYQKAVGDKGYGEMKNATTEGEKGIARGLREQISKAVPGVAETNAKESELINALKLAERRAHMSANNNIVGLGWMINSPLALPLWLAERSPALGGLMARALYSGRNVLPYGVGAGSAGALMAQQGVAPGQSPVLDLTGDGALYSPPPRGTPMNLAAGGTR